MEMNPTDMNQNTKDKGINIVAIIMLIWEKRKLLIKNSIIAGIVGLIIVFSIPRKYSSYVVLAPEGIDANSLSNAVSSIASLSGFDFGSQTGDAIYPELYPTIVGSTSFLVDLFDVKVTSKDGELNTTLYDYMQKHQKRAWWSYIFGFPTQVMNWFKGKKAPSTHTKTISDSPKTSSYHLTKQQTGIASMISNAITCKIDKKTQAITISVQMQDPIIATEITDSVRVHLHNFIIKYRTNKARTDLAYITKLFNSAKDDYTKAQQKWADFTDKNMNIVSARYKSEEERLSNEMQLAFTVYSQATQQLQMAKAKVQERVPVYSIIEPAVVPIKASSPKRMMTLILLVFLTCLFTSAYLIIKALQQEDQQIILK
jgi:LPS O-antigen subunit length determinant protein (WzzB/FepE family)